MQYRPSDGKWQVGPKVEEIQRLKKESTSKQYEEQKRALQEYLCHYFSWGDCNTSQGSQISPMGASKKGGKILKVRWNYPGGGKSGGMRLVVVAYCKEKRVHIAAAIPRKDDPSTDDILSSTSDL
jgi:hypothetical protein